MSNFFDVGVSKLYAAGTAGKEKEEERLCLACMSSNATRRVALGFTIDTLKGRCSLSMLTGCRGLGTPPTTSAPSLSSPHPPPFPAPAPSARAERLPPCDLCPRL